MYKTQVALLIAILTIFVSTAAAQKQYEGYSLTVAADTSGACPVKWLPSIGGGNVIEVFVAGTGQQTPAGGLRACGESTVQGSRVIPNGYGKWCFTGSEELYDIKLTNGITYLWHPLTRESGFYNIKDFRPVTYFPQAPVKYQYSEPADYTKTIKNAVAYIAARQGGTLLFPDGDYVVGTLDGNRRDPAYDGITLPSGIMIQGTSSNLSVVNSDFPFKTGSTRVRLRNDKQTIFRIGGCTNHVTIRNIELVGNSGLLGEAQRSITGTYGIEAMGKWVVDPATGAESSNTSQMFRFEEMTIQNFERGIYVHNANDDRCNPRDQRCYGWQFDYVKVDHVNFLYNGTGIWVDTNNTDWNVSSSIFTYLAKFQPPGDGIHLQRSGSMLIEQSWGGGIAYGTHVGGTFLNIDWVSTLTMINSGVERSERSLFVNPLGGITSMMITVVGGGFFDPVELHGRLNYVSTGNHYGARTINADPQVNITSTGDRFCHDPGAAPGQCVDFAGKVVNDPGFSGGRIMFQTGRVAEGSGANRIAARPNRFGYNLEMTDGLIQHDPNITFANITAWASPTSDRPPLKDGALVYCKDCRKSPNGTCAQGAAGTDGAFAKRINGQWRCD